MREFDDESAALAHQQELEQRQQLADSKMPETLAVAFVKAQAEIEKAAKDKSNPHFRSKYADLGNVIDAIKPALEQHGLAFFQKFHQCNNGIAIETIIIHTSGESMSNGILTIPADRGNAQGFGSACTYARRYSLQAAFGVAPEDDDGNAASRNSKQAQEVNQRAGHRKDNRSLDELYQAAMTKIANSDGTDIQSIKTYAEVTFAKDKAKLDAINKACSDKLEELLGEVA